MERFLRQRMMTVHPIWRFLAPSSLDSYEVDKWNVDGPYSSQYLFVCVMIFNALLKHVHLYATYSVILLIGTMLTWVCAPRFPTSRTLSFIHHSLERGCQGNHRRSYFSAEICSMHLISIVMNDELEVMYYSSSRVRMKIFNQWTLWFPLDVRRKWNQHRQ